MGETINYKMWTMCVVMDGDYILLLDRQHGDFQGFIPPGGKVDFPESIVMGAIREVKEETGLTVSNLEYKGLYEYVNPEKRNRYMIFHYITNDFSGELLQHAPEGLPVWVHRDELHLLPMQESVRRRIPYIFDDGTFEIQVEWDQLEDKEGKVSVIKT